MTPRREFQTACCTRIISREGRNWGVQVRGLFLNWRDPGFWELSSDGSRTGVMPSPSGCLSPVQVVRAQVRAGTEGCVPPPRGLHRPACPVKKVFFRTLRPNGLVQRPLVLLCLSPDPPRRSCSTAPAAPPRRVWRACRNSWCTLAGAPTVFAAATARHPAPTACRTVQQH